MEDNDFSAKADRHGEWLRANRRAPTTKCTICHNFTSVKKRTYSGVSHMVCFECRQNRDKYRAQMHKKSNTLKKKLIKERGDMCEMCGNAQAADAHHITRVVDGGSGEPSNLILLCKPCHKKQHRGKS